MEKCKKNLTSLDISALVSELKTQIVGLRLSNIFDINPKTYLLKFAKNEQKACLIIESGVRFHTTSAKVEKSRIPSGFTMKFRKYLRSKKLDNIEQIGCERVVDMKFGQDNCFHLLLEFYSQGNIILTDKDYVILQLIRSHEFNENVKTALGCKYPFELAAPFSLSNFEISEAKIKKLLFEEAKEEKVEIPKTEETNKKKGKETEKSKPKKGGGAPKGSKFKEILFQLLPCLNPAFTDHIVKENEINGNMRCEEQHIGLILKVAKKTLDFLFDFQTKSHQGYLTIAPKREDKKLIQSSEESKEPSESKAPVETYSDFAPIHYLQITTPQKICQTFNESLDLYFSVMETKSEQAEFEQKAWKKFENIKQDQENRLLKLQKEQEEFLLKAGLIQQNVQDIEAIIAIVRTLVESGYSWEKLTKMINDSRKSGDPLANMIHSMNWEHDEVTILLGDPSKELDEEMIPVNINFTISAFQNADEYYSHRKKNFAKEKKTIEASQTALKQAEKTAKSEISKAKDKIDTINARKIYWFEKFYWFISSENILVISGRDVQQNELLVKKYLNKGDLYLHADYHGASSTIIKGAIKDGVILNTTIDEAAMAAAARSKAWENKILASVWWVYDYQVSKSAPTGEYLPAGSFMIRGKKNFVKPPRLEMAFGLYFKIDELNLPSHQNDRIPKDLGEKREEKGEKEEESKNEEKKLPIQPENLNLTEEYSLVGSDLQPRILNPIKRKEGGKKEKGPVKKDEGVIIKEDEGGKKDDGKGKGKKEEKEEKEKGPDNLPRGKKQKIKKMMKKYGEQDEEEKEIRMKLIGASEMKHLKKNKKGEEDIEPKVTTREPPKQKFEPKINDKIEKKERNLGKEPPSKEPTNRPEINEIKILQSEIPKTEEVKIAEPIEPLNQELIEKKEEEKANEKESENEEDKDDSEIDVEAVEKANAGLIPEITENLLEKIEWDTLVGTPLSDDTYFFIVPVCAPFASLQTCKYKLKLIPGSLKKGKAAKNLQNYFLSLDGSVLEKKLIRTLNDFDLTNNLIGGVKLVGSGVQKLIDNEKKSKKDKKIKKEMSTKE